MKILVTGHLGYVGTVLTQYLLDLQHEVSGLDSGYYRERIDNGEHETVRVIGQDLRDCDNLDLRNYDAIVNLAALSNDPIGELDTRLTYDINRDAAIKIAEIARAAGVPRFIYVSTQSIYGISKSDDEVQEDGIKSPQTAYAKSKWEAEQVLLGMNSPFFTVVALRPSTVFGWSPRLRSDIVFNNLLLSGLRDGKISVHSDGTPWRPIVDVRDLARAIYTSLISDAANVGGEAFNIGNLNGNYTVREIAEAAQTCLAGIPIEFNTENIADPRSYRVSFQKAKAVLGFEAKGDLILAGKELIAKLKECDLPSGDYLGRRTNRLKQISYLVEKGDLDESLRFRS
jgi:nucleoside-diphosphate-sugar epimerase